MARPVVALLALFSVLCAGGCHSSVPVTGSPVAGQQVALSLTDRGRVALGDRVGPETDELRGTLVGKTDSSFTLAMKQAVTLRRVSNTWTGESLSVPVLFVGTVRERRADRGRSWLLAGGVATAVVAFIATRSFLDGNTAVDTDPSKPPTGPDPVSIRVPATIPFWSH